MTKSIDVSDNMPGSYEIVFGGDEHCFVEGFAWSLAEATKGYIKSKKHCYWTSHGDQIDFMNPQDKRYKLPYLKNQDGDIRDKPTFQRAQDQWEGFITYFNEIGDKCLEVGLGNHECRPGIVNVVNVAEVIADAFGCDWGTPMTHMNFGQFRAFLWHPFKFNMNLKAGDPAQRYTNECMRIKRAMRFKPGSPESEVSVMSHVHKIRINPPQCGHQVLLSRGKNKKLKGFHPTPQKIHDPVTKQWYYHEDHRWFASTGALFGQYVDNDYTYPETMDYDPVDLGWIKAVVKNDKFMGLEEVIL